MLGESEFLNSTLFSMYLMPLLIFFARIMDVSIGTVRLIFVARGMRVLAPVLGFFEILIWIVAIGQIMENLNAWYYYIAYAGGFASGTWVGIWIEDKLAIGMVSIRVITRSKADELEAALRENNFAVTTIMGEGSKGPAHIIYLLVDRRLLGSVVRSIKRYNPRAFYVVEDVRFVKEGTFPAQAQHKAVKGLKKRSLMYQKRK